jgi:uncharacterized cupin superfamily protein
VSPSTPAYDRSSTHRQSSWGRPGHMKEETCIKFNTGSGALDPSPITASWILEGNPVARSRMLSNRDGAYSVIWDCTAGRFNWFYDCDETIYIIEGSVVLKDADGVQRRVSAGETIYFPMGSRAEWLVEKYIRKVAFCANPQPSLIRLMNRAWRKLKRIASGSPEGAPTGLLAK